MVCFPVISVHMQVFNHTWISFKVVPYTPGKIWSARLIFLFFLAVCLNISTVINIKILTNSNQQTQSYKFTNHIAAFLSVGLITEMLEICIQTSSDQNVQLILKSYLPVMYGTPLWDLSNLKMSLRLIKFTFVLTVRCSLFPFAYLVILITFYMLVYYNAR